MMAGYFDRTYEHWRTSTVADGYGGFTETAAKVADLLGRAYPVRKSDEVIAARRSGEVIWTFATAGGTDIRIGDEIRFDDRVLLIVATAETSTGRRLECQCQEIQ